MSVCVCVCLCVCVCVCVCEVLEFELRKAQETIKSLRGSLTQATGKYPNIHVLYISQEISGVYFPPHMYIQSDVRPTKDKKTTNLVKSDVSNTRTLQYSRHSIYTIATSVY